MDGNIQRSRYMLIYSMAAAEVSELDTLDLSGYRCVYISFGSKNQEGITPFYQDFPFFLEYINKYPLCVISIDHYDTFEKKEQDVPFDLWSAKPRKRYTHVTIPSRTMDQTIHITQKLVSLLSKSKPEQVFFVNFIKYKHKDAHDAGPEKEAIALQSQLGVYKDNYYEWCGFTLFHDFHQGGYAKTTKQQIDFMNLLWDHCNIPTDIVYTSKVFFAVNELIKQNYFKPNSRVLVIHSGGLQGNRSLAKGTLQF